MQGGELFGNVVNLSSFEGGEYAVRSETGAVAIGAAYRPATDAPGPCGARSRVKRALWPSEPRTVPPLPHPARAVRGRE